MRDNIEHEEGEISEEGALSGRKGTGLFWSKNNERERSDGGGGECTRAFSQDPPQLNFLDVVF